jgi:hypothetical protein
MDYIKNIEEILYNSKTRIDDQSYIKLMENLSKIYKQMCNHINLEDGVTCPHCMEEIEYDEIEND